MFEEEEKLACERKIFGFCNKNYLLIHKIVQKNFSPQYCFIFFSTLHPSLDSRLSESVLKEVPWHRSVIYCNTR